MRLGALLRASILSKVLTASKSYRSLLGSPMRLHWGAGRSSHVLAASARMHSPSRTLARIVRGRITVPGFAQPATLISSSLSPCTYAAHLILLHLQAAPLLAPPLAIATVGSRRQSALAIWICSTYDIDKPGHSNCNPILLVTGQSAKSLACLLQQPRCLLSPPFSSEEVSF